ETPWPGKEIHYRMHPLNIGCLSAAGISGCALANNHILDGEHEGLSETRRTLDAAGVKHAGAGNDAEDAAAPAALNVPGKCRVLLFSFGSTTSGIPRQWRAANASPGVDLLDDLSEATASQIGKGMRHFQRPGDLLVAWLAWGVKWGDDFTVGHTGFARRLRERVVSGRV